MKRGSLVEKSCPSFYCSSQSEVENYMRLWQPLVDRIELEGISDLNSRRIRNVCFIIPDSQFSFAKPTT